jgi:hypothetical protein
VLRVEKWWTTEAVVEGAHRTRLRTNEKGLQASKTTQGKSVDSNPFAALRRKDIEPQN